MKKENSNLLDDLHDVYRGKKSFTERLRTCLDRYYEHTKMNDQISFDLRIELNSTTFKGLDQFRLIAMKKTTCDILFQESGTLEEVLIFAENYFKYPLKEVILDGHKYRLVQE